MDLLKSARAEAANKATAELKASKEIGCEIDVDATVASQSWTTTRRDIHSTHQTAEV